MERVNIMLTRVREQLSALPQVQATGRLRVTANPVLLAPTVEVQTTEQQVQAVADQVTEMLFIELGFKQNLIGEESHQHVD